MPDSTTDRDGPSPQDTPAAADPLGAPIRVFKGSVQTRLAIAACGAVMVISGTFIALYPSGQFFFGSFLAGWGGVVLFLALVLGRKRLLVCPGGVIREKGRTRETLPWAEVSEIVHTRMKIRMVTSRNCAIVKNNGARMVFTDLEIGEFNEMIATLHPLADALRIRWKEEEVSK